MRNLVIILNVLLIAGCTSNNSTVTNVVVENNTTVETESVLEFVVPSELPVAYVGTPYFYSFCDPQPEPIEGFNTHVCGRGVTPVNPKGGTGPYEVTIESLTDWFVTGLYSGGDGLLNFTAKLGDEGEYTLRVCAKDLDYNEVCRNTTLFIMSGNVTVKGGGVLSHELLLKVNSVVKTADFAGNSDEKLVRINYSKSSGFTFSKVVSSMPAATCTPSSARCGGGSTASLDVSASADSVSVTAEGGAACGRANPYGGFEVDYYMVGYVGYQDNLYLALSLNNSGTSDKVVDVIINLTSGLGSGSQNYFEAVANAQVCINYNHCVSVPTGTPGSTNANSTVYRVIVRPGVHWLSIGRMNNNFANTNMITCPSSVKSTSTAMITIIPADLSDGRRAIGSIYTTKSGTDVK